MMYEKWEKILDGDSMYGTQQVRNAPSFFSKLVLILFWR